MVPNICVFAVLCVMREASRFRGRKERIPRQPLLSSLPISACLALVCTAALPFFLLTSLSSSVLDQSLDPRDSDRWIEIERCKERERKKQKRREKRGCLHSSSLSMFFREREKRPTTLYSLLIKKNSGFTLKEATI